jgi:hypothetical protein
MQRVTKRSIALAVAGLVVGTVGALSAPAFADTASAHRSAMIPSVTLDFNGTNDEVSTAQQVGTTFGGRAVVKDANGNRIGEAYDICSKDKIESTSDTVYCNGQINLPDGAVAFSAVLPISDNANNPEHGTITGVVTGGTHAYEGATGEVIFQPKSQGVFDASFR